MGGIRKLAGRRRRTEVGLTRDSMVYEPMNLGEHFQDRNLRGATPAGPGSSLVQGHAACRRNVCSGLQSSEEPLTSHPRCVCSSGYAVVLTSLRSPSRLMGTRAVDILETSNGVKPVAAETWELCEYSIHGR
ncbi:hypothetical protein CHARACLAT_017342 [Characodon lateralis]|uniref:Uncharacterized protein n=1 Tax=Characodon lateralis TaxID=208331 RepID=A0ABU7F629_9TELE|nr:hypothetical protein [Characodon lateralis]